MVAFYWLGKEKWVTSPVIRVIVLSRQIIGRRLCLLVGEAYILSKVSKSPLINSMSGEYVKRSIPAIVLTRGRPINPSLSIYLHQRLEYNTLKSPVHFLPQRQWHNQGGFEILIVLKFKNVEKSVIFIVDMLIFLLLFFFGQELACLSTVTFPTYLHAPARFVLASRQVEVACTFFSF